MKKEIIKHLDKILDYLEINQENGYFDKTTYLSGLSPCHADADNPTGFSIYYDSGLWQCWSRGCHEEYGCDVIGLIKAIKKINTIEATKIVENIILQNIGEQNTYSKMEKREKINKVDYWKNHLEQKTFSLFEPGYSLIDYCNKREIDVNVIKVLDAFICNNPTNPLSNRFVIPIKNIDGKIVGFSGRSLVDNVKPKWLHWPSSQKINNEIKKGFSKSINLFNLKNAKESNSSFVIITEGPFDTIKCIMAGFPNSVSILGNIISYGQVEILKHCGFTDVILALDNDEAGKNGTEKSARKLARNLFRLWTIPLLSHKDLGECSVDEIQELIKNKQRF